ncbi:hypothetical protein V5799_032192 [Amblyomma americanum]|uniref:Uncharacterized protein n=1 Tax=Amblyomma americanum TaxID=6943 RepID=A0AAQ4DRV5_AMBAM
MDRFIQNTAGGICIGSFLWNVVHSSDFEDARKKMREKMDRSFTVARFVVPMIMVLMFVGSCVIFWCIWYHRRQRFWAMQQQQQCRMPPPLAPAPGPGPVTSGATTFGHSEVNPLIPRAVTPPPPAFYPPQPATCPTEGPYANFNSAPSAQLLSGAAMPSAPREPPPPYNTYSSETKQPL